MLQKFGKNGALFDSTNGTNMYDFYLMTLLVIDEYGEGQPFGWCITNHEIQEFVEVFCQCIKEKSGIVQADWFMSDLAPQYYNAFSKVNACSPKQLWCAWHVDKASREELNKKVKNHEVEVDAYKRLKYLGEMADCNVFDDYADGLVKSLLSSSITKAFGEYFQRHWVNRKEQWACFYRNKDKHQHALGGISQSIKIQLFAWEI